MGKHTHPNGTKAVPRPGRQLTSVALPGIWGGEATGAHVQSLTFFTLSPQPLPLRPASPWPSVAPQTCWGSSNPASQMQLAPLWEGTRPQPRLACETCGHLWPLGAGTLLGELQEKGAGRVQAYSVAACGAANLSPPPLRSQSRATVPGPVHLLPAQLLVPSDIGELHSWGGNWV